MQAFLTRISLDTEALFEAAGSVKPAEASKICQGIERAIRGLEQLRERLPGQAELESQIEAGFRTVPFTADAR